MAVKTNNFNNDLAMPYWNNTTKQRVFREIAAETEKGNTGLATKRQLQEEATQLSVALRDLAADTAESIGALDHEMQITYAGEFNLTYNPDDGLFYDSDDPTKFYANIYARIQADAESISEQFSSMERIVVGEEGETDIRTALAEMTDLFNGEIRRGFVEVVEGGTTKRYFGIAITSRDIFTATTRTNDYDPTDQNTYYQVDTTDTGYCFGLYTAEGWQFWRGNTRMGWYDTAKKQLHVEDLDVDKYVQVGGWQIYQSSQVFGIKYTG